MLVPPTVFGVKSGTEYHQYEGERSVGFLTWREAVIAAVLLALLILYLVLRDR